MNESTTSIRVWDPLVRLFHWSLVIFFTIAWFTGDENNSLHIWSGYVIAGLLLFRLIWGFAGTRHARFSDFVFGPGRVIGYLKSLAGGKPRHYDGHNPAGGYMVIMLLLMLGLTTWTGLEVYGSEGHGPLATATGAQMSTDIPGYRDILGPEEEEYGEEAGESGDAAEEFWEEIHEVAANLTVALIMLHILGVIVSSRLHRENLVKAMITGDKTRLDD